MANTKRTARIERILAATPDKMRRQTRLAFVQQSAHWARVARKYPRSAEARLLRAIYCGPKVT